MLDGDLCHKMKHPEQVGNLFWTPKIFLPHIERADCQARRKL
jgi:hypothetical protein